jgi:hypothetical protein
MSSPNRTWGEQLAFIVGYIFLSYSVPIIMDKIFNPPRPNHISTPVKNPVEDILRPLTATRYREGVAAVILIDTSGSMQEQVRDASGGLRPKIAIARRAALNLVDQVDRYVREHSDKSIVLGVYEFSDRDKGPSCRTVVELGPLDIAVARSAIMAMRAEGDTPIGDAMIKAKRDLDATGLSKRHILVITDGENTKGYSPDDVMRAITKQSDKDRAWVYFVAFDVDASTFDSVRDSGGQVLAASNETELKGTLDYLLAGRILVEKPDHRYSPIYGR